MEAALKASVESEIASKYALNQAAAQAQRQTELLQLNLTHANGIIEKLSMFKTTAKNENEKNCYLKLT